VVVVKEENAEPSEAGYGDEVFRAVGSVAEGGSEVHQAGYWKILFCRICRDRTREEERNQEQEKVQGDPLENSMPLGGGHGICNGYFKLTAVPLLS